VVIRRTAGFYSSRVQKHHGVSNKQVLRSTLLESKHLQCIHLARRSSLRLDTDRPRRFLPGLAESPGAMFSCALWPYLPPREKA
jgi:hypothetical protein